MALLAQVLHRFIRIGELRVTDPGGRVHHFGKAGSEPSAAVRIHDPSLCWRLFVDSERALGEGWMDGTLTAEGCTLHDFLAVFSVNLDCAETLPLEKISQKLSELGTFFRQANSLRGARRNVAHHYDLSEMLYELFLDADWQYSCAYFESPDESLEQAQENKKRHIAEKLLIEPGMRVLDIGSGWGGLAIYLAREYGAQVTGITLSTAQLAKAQARARAVGLDGNVRFALTDYREMTGTYDRIVSVGMFEHVGTRQYPAFFGKLKSLLAPHGIALLHSIGRMDGPGTTNKWLDKWIFPGGYAPALSEVLAVSEKSGLWATDIEVLRLHYAETLRHWYERFQVHRGEIAALYDERFCRMWEFYLVGAEMDFRYLRTMVFQIQISREIDAVPLTRDYMFVTRQRRESLSRNLPQGETKADSF
jgi:cyclopropane-fatty-acyl-phospholipid synthase